MSFTCVALCCPACKANSSRSVQERKGFEPAAPNPYSLCLRKVAGVRSKIGCLELSRASWCTKGKPALEPVALTSLASGF